jgi:hypothetical protein
VPEPTDFVVKKGPKHSSLYYFPPKYATIIRECKYRYIKVKFPEIIEATASDLKIILSYHRAITRSKKNQTLYGLK